MGVLIATLPVHERPRERLFAHGVETLADRELVALVLRNGTNGVSAIDLATELLAEYGSLAALATARPEEIAARKGIGEAKAGALIAALRLGHRAGVAPPRQVIREPQDAALIAQQSLHGLARERVIVMVCDTANHLRRVVTVCEGALDMSLLPVREVLNAVLRHDGRGFAVAHNHPSGVPEPSNADREATGDVIEAAQIAGLRFLGHVVVTDTDWREVT